MSVTAPCRWVLQGHVHGGERQAHARRCARDSCSRTCVMSSAACATRFRESCLIPELSQSQMHTSTSQRQRRYWQLSAAKSVVTCPDCSFVSNPIQTSTVDFLPAMAYIWPAPFILSSQLRHRFLLWTQLDLTSWGPVRKLEQVDLASSQPRLSAGGSIK